MNDKIRQTDLSMLQQEQTELKFNCSCTLSSVSRCKLHIYLSSSIVQALETTLEEQATMCQDILQMEEQASTGVEDKSGQKWPLLTLARLREVQHQLSHPDSTKCPEAEQIYQALIQIDPYRKGYYIDAMNGKAAQVTRSLH